jgi:hypothetical protein
MARVQAWRPWLLASALLSLMGPGTGAAVRAEEAPTEGGEPASAVVCVTRALRIGAAEVNGIARRCEDSSTHAVTTTVTFSSPAADGAPLSYTPLPDEPGSDATATPDPQP